MQQELLEVQRERFSLTDNSKYILQGIWPRGGEAVAVLDDQTVEAGLEKWENNSALERFKKQENCQWERITLNVRLPKNLEGKHELNIYAVSNGKRKRWFRVKGADLCAKRKKPQFYLEQILRSPKTGTCCVNGWVASSKPVDIKITDLTGNVLPCKINRITRVDVQEVYKECAIEEKCGFTIEIRKLFLEGIRVEFIAGNEKTEQYISMRRREILKENIRDYLQKTVRFTRTHGILALPQKILEKLSGKNRAVQYSEWIKRHLPNVKELEQQSNTVFVQQPVFSIVVPLFKTPEKLLRKLVESVQAQTYSQWELCLSDGSGAPSPLDNVLMELEQSDERIRIVHHESAMRISENTNSALKIARGDYIVFVDHDDELTPNALFECVKAINGRPELDILYSDEDKITLNKKSFFQPHMKPDFNLDLLRTVNYICHLLVVSQKLIYKVGMFRSEYDGAQDYDFILRCIEASDKICHIPKILYHWRCHGTSTAENPESKMYAFEAGRRAVQAHYDRLGIRAKVIQGEFPGLYRTKYIRACDPLVSILIPNKDHIEDLERCIKAIDTKSTYKNYEYIIIENNSEQEETFQYYTELESKNRKVRVVYWKGTFNYSAINNYGASFARGEYLLLLNNDTEIINNDCLEELLGYCMRADVGAVGARLYYEDDTIQHAGVVVGFGGIAGHCFVQQKRGYTGYCHRIICAQDYSAVTAACMMVDKRAFDEVGGLSEELAVAFNDIDFCLKLRGAGYLIVYNPYAELYHYESKSRGLDDTPEKVSRFNKEIETFAKRWPEILQNGDPYYNPNLTLDSQDFSLRRN
ncbi:glycosyltransferase family 2 protein [Wansuia hejianensis]|uniref:Glycosyltransferase family 2 protein n=1 Tax=Wansuia hejianensis TaxID=2763667 RepID=A0A7G9GHD3_9FIRM|nr:glycosyltransferase family 2 protein [Wansuia hejianensis]QNM10215.1 glycosyltransferase family 2 protein [Wansuia hejianensis]RHV88504.1 glycosyltransferase family 2 protein [Lachnospiraceae bacterium OF09-33XD]